MSLAASEFSYVLFETNLAYYSGNKVCASIPEGFQWIISSRLQSPVSFQTVPEDPISKRTDTVGRVQPHVRAKLVDTDGSVVPLKTPGEVCVSGYLVHKGCVQTVGVNLCPVLK